VTLPSAPEDLVTELADLCVPAVDAIAPVQSQAYSIVAHVVGVIIGSVLLHVG
jgi:phage-related protein